jgi:hypothetical protein
MRIALGIAAALLALAAGTRIGWGAIAALLVLAFVALAFLQGLRVKPREGPPDRTDGGRRFRP